MLSKSDWNGELPVKSKNASLISYKYYLTLLSAGENGYFEIMYLINCIICCYYSRMINRLCGFNFYLPCIEIYHTWQSVSRVLMRLVKRLLCACHHPSSQHCVTAVTLQSQWSSCTIQTRYGVHGISYDIHIQIDTPNRRIQIPNSLHNVQFI